MDLKCELKQGRDSGIREERRGVEHCVKPVDPDTSQRGDAHDGKRDPAASNVSGEFCVSHESSLVVGIPAPERAETVSSVRSSDLAPNLNMLSLSMMV